MDPEIKTRHIWRRGTRAVIGAHLRLGRGGLDCVRSVIAEHGRSGDQFCQEGHGLLPSPTALGRHGASVRGDVSPGEVVALLKAEVRL